MDTLRASTSCSTSCGPRAGALEDLVTERGAARRLRGPTRAAGPRHGAHRLQGLVAHPLARTRLGAERHRLRARPADGPERSSARRRRAGSVATTRPTSATPRPSRAAFAAARPEVVFHLAAQPLVRGVLPPPAETFEINVIGHGARPRRGPAARRALRRGRRHHATSATRTASGSGATARTTASAATTPTPRQQGRAELVVGRLPALLLPSGRLGEHGVAHRHGPRRQRHRRRRLGDGPDRPRLRRARWRRAAVPVRNPRRHPALAARARAARAATCSSARPAARGRRGARVLRAPGTSARAGGTHGRSGPRRRRSSRPGAAAAWEDSTIPGAPARGRTPAARIDKARAGSAGSPAGASTRRTRRTAAWYRACRAGAGADPARALPQPDRRLPWSACVTTPKQARAARCSAGDPASGSGSWPATAGGAPRPFVPGHEPGPLRAAASTARRRWQLVERASTSGSPPGRWHRRFERELAAARRAHAVLVNSGSCANLVAFAALTSHLLGRPAPRRATR